MKQTFSSAPVYFYNRQSYANCSVLLFTAPRRETTKIIATHLGPVIGAVYKYLNFKCVYVIGASRHCKLCFARFDYFCIGILLGLEESMD
jgi:hypothetical protein